MPYIPYISALIGLLVGGVIGYLAFRQGASAEAAGLRAQLGERDAQAQEQKAVLVAREDALRAAADQRIALEARVARGEAELQSTRTHAQEQLALLNDARARLEDAFKGLAHDTLKANSESFMNLARSHLASLIAQEDGQLDKRRESIEKLLTPISDTLKRYEDGLRVIEKSRQEAYAGLREQAGRMAEDQEKLRRETANLVNALRLPQTRGRWGEMTLRRAVEVAGLAEHCDFSEQVTVDTADGRLRPDMIVRLPAHREVVVDAKVSLSAYLDAIEAVCDEDRTRLLVDHARQVRAHMDRLASKDYSRQFPRAPEFVVLFLPGEVFFSAALQHDPDILEDGVKRGVILATPTTLIALLRAVAHGWREASMEENARRISEAGRELYNRMGVVCRYLTQVGRSLGQATESYNQAVGSVNTRLLPQARRIRELGATSEAELADLPPQEAAPRPLDAPEPAQDAGAAPCGTE